MAGVSLCLQGLGSMTMDAHSVGVFREPQGFGIVCSIFAMDIMAMAAVDLTLLKAGGTLQRLYDKGGFPEATVFVEGFPRKLSERSTFVGRIERGCGRPVIQFPVWSCIAHRRLAVTLATDTKIFTARDSCEVNGRLRCRFFVGPSCSHGADMAV